MRSVFCEWWESVGGYPGYQRPSNQLCFGPTRSHTLKEVCEAEKGTGLMLGVRGGGSDREGKNRVHFLEGPCFVGAGIISPGASSLCVRVESGQETLLQSRGSFYR